jgi:hypothetical protein
MWFERARKEVGLFLETVQPLLGRHAQHTANQLRVVLVMWHQFGTQVKASASQQMKHAGEARLLPAVFDPRDLGLSDTRASSQTSLRKAGLGPSLT